MSDTMTLKIKHNDKIQSYSHRITKYFKILTFYWHHNSPVNPTQMIKESQRDSIMSNPVQALTILSGRSTGYIDRNKLQP